MRLAGKSFAEVEAITGVKAGTARALSRRKGIRIQIATRGLHRMQWPQWVVDEILRRCDAGHTQRRITRDLEIVPLATVALICRGRRPAVRRWPDSAIRTARLLSRDFTPAEISKLLPMLVGVRPHSATISTWIRTSRRKLAKAIPAAQHIDTPISQ